MTNVNILRGIVWFLWIMIFGTLVVKLALCGEDFDKKHKIRMGLIGTIASMGTFEIVLFVNNILR